MLNISIAATATQIMNDYWEDEDNVYVVYSKYLYKLLYVGKEPPYDGFVPSEQ